MAEIFNRLITLRIIPKVMCAPPLTAFWGTLRVSRYVECRCKCTARRYAAGHVLARLVAHAGLGASRIKKLIEHYGSVEQVFRATLTELEAGGMQAVSAQSIATGKSLELAQLECGKAVEARARII
jgi:hypothetical protein